MSVELDNRFKGLLERAIKICAHEDFGISPAHWTIRTLCAGVSDSMSRKPEYADLMAELSRAAIEWEKSIIE